MLKLALALIALTAAQEPGAPPVQLWTQGTAEAPAQPTGRSSAGYVRGARNVPQSAGIAAQRVRTPVGSLVEVRGQEENQLIGVGLVSGLGGTGDSTNMVRQVLQNLLLASNIKIDPQQLTAKNV